MTEIKKIQHVIFDVSGTLIDDSERVLCTTNSVLNHFGKAAISMNEFKQKCTLNFPRFWQELDVYKPGMNFEIFYTLWEKYYNNKIPVKVYSGTVEVLSQIYDKNKKIYAFSSINKKELEEILKTHDLLKYFTKINGSVRHKASEIFRFLKEIDAKAKECVFVGDMTGDIVAAKEAGIVSVAVSYGYHDAEKLKKEKPDYIVNSLREFLQILDEK